MSTLQQMRSLVEKLDSIGFEVQDVDEETYDLFSYPLPSTNLGMINEKVATISVEVAGKDYCFHQSPGLLTSERTGGTTGAVLWKITPLVAAWLADAKNSLWCAGLVSTESTIVELGSGICGLIGCAVVPFIRQYIWTDQEYVLRTLRENVQANTTSSIKDKQSFQRMTSKRALKDHRSNVVELDWEQDDVRVLSDLLQDGRNLDMVIVCDCVYNDFLIEPLIRTCRNICTEYADNRNIVLLIAQQLRSDEIFSNFMAALMRDFRVWRISDNALPGTLQSGSSFIVHLAILRDV